MADKINYNSEDINEARVILNDSIRILESEISTPLSKDFKVLSETGLFTEGLSKLQAQFNTLANDHTTFLNSLASHDSDLSTFEKEQADAVRDYIEDNSNNNSYYGGERSSHKKKKSKDKDDGNEISDKELKNIVADLSYSKKLQALQSILNMNGVDLTSLLTNQDNSNVLSYLLKQILNDSSAEISDNPTKYEKLIQETLLESIAKDDNNVFASLKEDSFLQGMTYLKDVANNNHVDVTDLVLDDKYSSLLLSSIKDMYQGKSETMLTSYEIKSVKAYVDKIASNNNISVDTLLSDTKYIDILKGGNSK